MYSVYIVSDSINSNGDRLTSFDVSGKCSLFENFTSRYFSTVITVDGDRCSAIITATEFDSLFLSKYDCDIFSALVNSMTRLYINNVPNILAPITPNTQPKLDSYHIPYITRDEFRNVGLRSCILASAARCIQRSYKNPNETYTTLCDDIQVGERLLSSGNFRSFEHQGQELNISNFTSTDISRLNYLKFRGLTHLDVECQLWSANFKGFGQARKFIEYI